MKELKKKQDAIKREVQDLERYDEVVPNPRILERNYHPELVVTPPGKWMLRRYTSSLKKRQPSWSLSSLDCLERYVTLSMSMSAFIQTPYRLLFLDSLVLGQTHRLLDRVAN